MNIDLTKKQKRILLSIFNDQDSTLKLGSSSPSYGIARTTIHDLLFISKEDTGEFIITEDGTMLLDQYDLINDGVLTKKGKTLLMHGITLLEFMAFS